MIILVAAAIATVVPPGTQTTVTTVADARDAQRSACAKLRRSPATAASRANFRRCLTRIRYDGDLPPR